MVTFDVVGVDLIDAGRHPLLDAVAKGAKWVGTDDYPAFVEWADEHEKWFRAVQATGGWHHYFPRLRGSKERRDEMLAEIAAAYFAIERGGLPILAWEPQGAGNKRGEFLLGLLPVGIAFIEVKSPGWEEEVVRQQGRRSPRLLEPKYVKVEGGWVDSVAAVRRTVVKAYPKLPDMMPTLLIINDDLKLGLNDSVILVKYALYSPSVPGGAGYQVEAGCFVGRQFERLGAVGILNVEKAADAAEPEFRFSIFRNPNALPTVGFPRSVFADHPSFDGLG